MKTKYFLEKSFPFFLVTLLVTVSACNDQWKIESPYDQVNWEKDLQYKANLHTHTTRSDGHLPPQYVVDWYHQHGYGILAITDHNKVTYPWTDFSSLDSSTKSEAKVATGEFSPEAVTYKNRNPEELGMIAIQGNEVSSPQHIGSLFNDFGIRTSQEDSAIVGIGEKDGLIIFNHPGRYNHEAHWYANLCEKYEHIIGLEVYNNGDRYPGDRQLWDSILVDLSSVRPLWAYSNDDMHQERSFGRNWNIIVLPELTQSWVRQGIKEGRSFYVYSPSGINAKVPTIRSVQLNQRKGEIEISVAGQDSIHWISGGKIVAKGKQIELNECQELSSYVRAEIFASPGIVLGMQPFFIEKN
nr:hypothetical protein [uncultured Draconibacterium sp.]